jgi:hypothetical protein
MKEKKGSIPPKSKETSMKDHWEMGYSMHTSSPNMKHTQGSDFAPKTSKERKTTHYKINEEDH